MKFAAQISPLLNYYLSGHDLTEKKDWQANYLTDTKKNILCLNIVSNDSGHHFSLIVSDENNLARL